MDKTMKTRYFVRTVKFNTFIKTRPVTVVTYGLIFDIQL